MDECEHVHQWQHLEIGQVMTAAHAFSLLPRILLSGLVIEVQHIICLLYTSPSPRDLSTSRMPSSA